MTSGDDMIIGFVAGAATDDYVDLTDFGFSDFDDGSANDVESALSQAGADAVLDLGAGSLTFVGVDMSTLAADDFMV